MVIYRDVGPAKPATKPTCVARLCAFFGLVVAPNSTQFGRLPESVQRVLSGKDDWLVELTFHAPNCVRNHVRLYLKEGWPDFETRYYDNVIDTCACGQGITIRTITLEGLFKDDINSFLLFIDFYADFDLEKRLDVMDMYHDYLRKNYTGGVDRFFSPTGSLERFQARVEATVADVRDHRFARTMEEAVSHLEPVVAGGEGVFDLTSEPGTGKTSVLPFKFPTKLVVVVLPTPFDAWSAYNMATGPCRLCIKGLTLGGTRAPVTYTDSYKASEMLLSGSVREDIIIVDECDSGKGVTAFLAEVRIKGKVLIRMSASHGRTSSAAASRAFPVTTSSAMPDIRRGVGPVADFVRERASGRTMVLAPDAESAGELARRVGGVLLTSAVGLRDMAAAVHNTSSDVLYVADDVCSRGVNLNLDGLFDCMLVTEYGTTRSVTAAEHYQRRWRVGRNKPGWYYSPDLDLSIGSGSTELDVVRSNVIRCIAGVRQLGSSALQVSERRALELLTACREPYLILSELRFAEVSASRSTGVVTELDDDSHATRSVSSSSRSSSRKGSTAILPKWVAFFSDIESAGPGSRIRRDSIATINKTDKGYEVAVKRRSGGSSRHGTRSTALARRAELPVAQGGPLSAGSGYFGTVAARVPEVACAPPLMNLTEMPYDMDWPEMVRRSLCGGGALPTLVPPEGWRHTSSGGMEIDWVRELDALSRRDHGFTLGEFEVVARAWNKLVAREWVRRTPGLRTDGDTYRMEFCVRYFQASFLNWSAA